DGLFVYCITPPSDPVPDRERIGRESALAAINNNAKNAALQLLKSYHEPYFFDMRKPDEMTMDFYLTNVKETIDQLEELDVTLPEAIVFYYTVRHLPNQYEI
ncbi:hypothetical protein M758_UG045100, partial [Ceratodon purpureus]